ncbi:hypothetical protein CBL_01004 [Carabus blaptoides fortunei]
MKQLVSASRRGDADDSINPSTWPSSARTAYFLLILTACTHRYIIHHYIINTLSGTLLERQASFCNSGHVVAHVFRMTTDCCPEFAQVPPFTHTDTKHWLTPAPRGKRCIDSFRLSTTLYIQWSQSPWQPFQKPSFKTIHVEAMKIAVTVVWLVLFLFCLDNSNYSLSYLPFKLQAARNQMLGNAFDRDMNSDLFMSPRIAIPYG